MLRAWRKKKSLGETCRTCGAKRAEKGEEVLGSIRHDLKNLLNGLTLLEYNANGNNDIISEMTRKIDQLISQEHFETHFIVFVN